MGNAPVVKSKRVVTNAVVASAVVLAAVVALASSDRASAAVPAPTQADTARLLGYMWADGSKSDSTWNVNGPSGTSTLIEYLVEQHGGTWVDRQKLRFQLPDPYDWPEWTDRLPDDSAWVRDAVQTQHFLAAVLESEASVDGLIYDQGAGEPDYTIGRLRGLRDLLRSKGYGTARRVQWANPDRGQITLGSADFARLRQKHRFVCPARAADVRVPGGEGYEQFGNLRWFTEANRWAGLVRNDCASGVAVTPIPPPAGTCTVSVDANDRVTVDWTFTRGNVNVRRNGSFVESVSVFDRTWSERPDAGTWTYSLRVFAAGTQADAVCGQVSTGGEDPPVEPPVGGCVATAGGVGVSLRWDDFGASNYAVRRNGRWVETVTSTSTSVAGSLDDSFVIRRRSGGQVIDVACTTAGDPAAPCSVTSIGGGIRLDFAPIEGVSQRIVRVNGRWLATTEGVESFIDPGGAPADDYVIRHWVAGQRVDVPCE